MKINESKVRRHYTETDKACPVIAANARNLNMLFLDGQLEQCCQRDDTIRMIQKILLRKNKANVMLTGPAGCGKTAVVEGVAGMMTLSRMLYIQACTKADRQWQKDKAKWEVNGRQGSCPERIKPPELPLCDCVIYDISLNNLVSGTKYRGTFEEKLQTVLAECKANPHVILFIDELHQFCTAGAAEGALSAAEILKPALARNEIRVIGATTTEEKVDIQKDKALARRFSEVEIRELRADAARKTAENILRNYCAYHNVRADVSAADLLVYVRHYLPETVFPDNYINVVDETLAGAVLDGLTSVRMQHFGETLSRMTGRVILCADQTDTAQAG